MNLSGWRTKSSRRSLKLSLLVIRIGPLVIRMCSAESRKGRRREKSVSDQSLENGGILKEEKAPEGQRQKTGDRAAATNDVCE